MSTKTWKAKITCFLRIKIQSYVNKYEPYRSAIFVTYIFYVCLQENKHKNDNLVNIYKCVSFKN